MTASACNFDLICGIWTRVSFIANRSLPKRIARRISHHGRSPEGIDGYIRARVVFHIQMTRSAYPRGRKVAATMLRKRLAGLENYGANGWYRSGSRRRGSGGPRQGGFDGGGRRLARGAGRNQRNRYSEDYPALIHRKVESYSAGRKFCRPSSLSSVISDQISANLQSTQGLFTVCMLQLVPFLITKKSKVSIAL